MLKPTHRPYLQLSQFPWELGNPSLETNKLENLEGTSSSHELKQSKDGRLWYVHAGGVLI